MALFFMSIKLTRNIKTFVDISLDFTPNPLTGDLTTIKDDRAINNAVKNLVLITPNEVPFRRDIGSMVSGLVFELCDEASATIINDEIRRTIEYNEPRVNIISLVTNARPDTNDFRVILTYNIIGADETFVVEQILTPTR